MGGTGRTIRVFTPSLEAKSESGIQTVLKGYMRHAADYGIEYTGNIDAGCDLVAIHAGMFSERYAVAPIVCHLHGLYWTGDFPGDRWQHQVNKSIMSLIRRCAAVTVPSDWVAMTLMRDMHISPFVLPHGIDFDDYQGSTSPLKHIMVYAKNRAGVDVCNPSFVPDFVNRFPDKKFVATFSPSGSSNLEIIGVQPHEEHIKSVQSSHVYISTTKETWGIGILEALACGVPVLGFNEGGIKETVSHGVNGYLAKPGDYNDLALGLEYCLAHRNTLSDNAKSLARSYSWDAVMTKLRAVYEIAMKPDNRPAVSVVIPVYNKTEEQVERAIKSVKSQTESVDKLIVVDDASTVETDYSSLLDLDGGDIYWRHEKNFGVAHARNTGFSLCSSRYVVFLDGDDWLEPEFVEVNRKFLDKNHSLGVSYTSYNIHYPSGFVRAANVPEIADFDQQLAGANQIPTCCMIRSDAFKQAGGYRQRYAPRGAGTEDANLWLRLGLLGWGGARSLTPPRFNYSLGIGTTFQEGYKPVKYFDGYQYYTPCGSLLRPKNGIAHPVRQLDDPYISVIIPVSVNHLNYLPDALDHLEMQSMHKWEVIVVLDGFKNVDRKEIDRLTTAFPYIKLHISEDVVGAGAARNIGVRYSEAPLILFLDADDWLQPTALSVMLESWNRHQAGVYTDYYGVAHVSDVTKLADHLQRNIIERDGDTGLTTIRYRSKPYSRSKAIAQPENPPYLWCNVTTLIPKSWHHEIGGFDENMPSWEDLDYWWRLAWIGKDFTHVQEPLLTYRFFTGERRQSGLSNWSGLIDYILEKKKHYIGG